MLKKKTVMPYFLMFCFCLYRAGLFVTFLCYEKTGG